MNAEQISALLPAGSLFAGKLTVLERTDSTNTRLRLLAEGGAPEGTAVIAAEQTAGRGTHGRSFVSAEGGLYLSVLLRPEAPLADLLTLTGRVGAAARRAVEAASGAPAEVKWLNDLWLGGRKLCGILCELGPVRGGRADYVVAGIGINAGQSRDSFAALGLGDIATSLAAEGWPVTREALCAAVLTELEKLIRAFPAGLAEDLADYRAHCLTVGRRVRTEQGEGLAVGIDGRFGLLVDHGGIAETVRFGGAELL